MSVESVFQKIICTIIWQIANIKLRRRNGTTATERNLVPISAHGHCVGTKWALIFTISAHGH